MGKEFAMRSLICRMFLFVCLLIPALTMGSDFDYDRYGRLLDHHVRPESKIDGIIVAAVDYASLAGEAKRSDSDYSLLLKDLTSFDPASLGSREEKIAFWVNVYNIAAIKTVVDYYPVESIRSRKINWLGLPWNRKVVTVGGSEYSLDEIENEILLKGFKDLRIHFGVNCASLSCVDLGQNPYRAAILYRQLEDQGRKFLANPRKGMRIEGKGKVVYLSQIFKFDKRNFDALAGGALNFILPYVSAEGAEALKQGNFRVEYLDYIWKANDIKNVQ